MAMDMLDIDKGTKNIEVAMAVLRNGWPLFPAGLSGVTASVAIALSIRPSFFHTVLGVPPSFEVLDEKSAWALATIVLALLSVSLIQIVLRKLIRAGVERSRPSVADARKAKEFIALLGWVDIKTMRQLADSPTQGIRCGTPDLTALPNNHPTYFIANTPSTIAITESYRPYLEIWRTGVAP